MKYYIYINVSNGIYLVHLNEVIVRGAIRMQNVTCIWCSHKHSIRSYCTVVYTMI